MAELYSLNKVMLIGNVGRPPEMRFTPSGVPTTTFSVATTRRKKVGDDWTDETEWHNVVTWERLAERMNEYLQKGAKVYVEGRIQTRSWEGQDGVKRYRTEVIAHDVKILTPRNRDGMAPAGVRSGGDELAPEPDDVAVDDLPF